MKIEESVCVFFSFSRYEHEKVGVSVHACMRVYMCSGKPRVKEALLFPGDVYVERRISL